MNTRRLVILGCLAVLAMTHKAHAVEVYSASAGVSIHSRQGFNDLNPGFGLRVSDGDIAAQVGEYRNSYKKSTVYAIGEYTPLRIGKVAIGGFAGLASAYTREQDPIAPLVAGFSARWSPARYGVAVKLVPPIGGAGFASIEFTARLF